MCTIWSFCSVFRCRCRKPQAKRGIIALRPPIWVRSRTFFKIRALKMRTHPMSDCFDVNFTWEWHHSRHSQKLYKQDHISYTARCALCSLLECLPHIHWLRTPLGGHIYLMLPFFLTVISRHQHLSFARPSSPGLLPNSLFFMLISSFQARLLAHQAKSTSHGLPPRPPISFLPHINFFSTHMTSTRILVLSFFQIPISLEVIYVSSITSASCPRQS